ncbi:MAG: SIR2 family protein, partial [Nitrospiraceae bacterium]|nr:SIR2 family protein [Nitrospiraceae bacterium]
LLMVGYGFRDPHINEVLARCVNENGLELYVLSPLPPGEFEHQLKLHAFGLSNERPH